MKIAALYDIHGNLPALESVIEVIKKVEPDHIVIGGDVVAGPMPVECLNTLKALSEKYPMSFIHGNAESEVLRALAGEAPNGFSERNDDIAQWVASKLSEEHIEWIKSWTLTKSIISNTGDDILFCHATPQNDVDIFTSNSPDEKVESFFEGISNTFVVCGHTHIQVDRQLANTRVLNAGSVGMSFSAQGAHWLIIDHEDLSFNHTKYNLVDAAARIRETDYPFADDFADNNVLSNPSTSKALDMLNALAEKQEAERVSA